MDSTLAKQMFEIGGTLIFLDMPIGNQFGIDMNSWRVAEKFKGIKMIPPGLHFISFSAVNKEGDVAPKSGFFHYFKEKDFIVKKYLPADEDIIEEENKEQIERMRDNIRSLDQNLGPYPLENYKKWISIVQHITKDDLQRLQPLCGNVNSVPELVYGESNPQEETSNPTMLSSDKITLETIKESDETEDVEVRVSLKKKKTIKPRPDINTMKVRPGTEIRFTKFPEKPYKNGATPREITNAHLDTSGVLKLMFNEFSRPEDFLAELQFSFITFLVCQVYDGFEQWKKLIVAVCKAEDLLLQHPDFYSKLISTLYFQIQEVPEDLFVDITENENFFAASIINLIMNIEENISAIPRELVKKARNFKQHIAKKYHWNLSVEEDGENAPVVVS